MAECAIITDAVSKLYVPTGYPAAASHEALTRAARIFPEAKTAMLWTTDSRFMEPENIKDNYRRCGVEAVEMETATYYAISRYFGMSSASISVISDEPIHLKDHDVPQFKYAETHQREFILPGVRKVLKSLIANLETWAEDRSPPLR